MEMIQVVILGIIQGLTEFLPISSSGHLLLGRKLFNINEYGIIIEVFLHLGTLFSILLFWSSDIKYEIKRFTLGNSKYVNSIINDVKWLGFNIDNNILYASDYFDQMYEYAIQLIKQGDAYVDDQDAEAIKLSRGTLNKPGRNSLSRDRTINENLELFHNMKLGKYKDGEKVLRAKIDMAASNINLRDPVIYRILHSKHHRTGNKWCIYPMYDWAHGLEDSIENVSHSICTLEFEDHRPLYDWFLKQLNIHHPQQIEFARLNLEYTIMSKRHLKKLVDNRVVSSWDDPRMPTISGLKRRGYPAIAIKDFIYSLGVAKNEGTASIEHLEHFARKHLNKTSYRAMAVLDPIKLIIDNYDENSFELLNATNNPEDDTAGERKICFGRELYIEKDDFMENPSKKFFRLCIGQEVRLMHAYYVKCTHITKNKNNEITAIHCTYDPTTKGGWSKDGRKVKGTIHWVYADKAINATINIYKKLFSHINPYNCKEEETFIDNLNSESLLTIYNAKLESSLSNALQNQNYQFLRKGYFILDPKSLNKNLIFNQTVGLRDTWKNKK